MRYKYRKALIVGVLLLAALSLQGWTQDRPEDKLLQEAKLLIFDAKWAPALDKLDKLLDQYPMGPTLGQALFYRAECLSKLDGRERDALRAYKEFLRNGTPKGAEVNESLVEQAERSIIDLSYTLYTKGDRDAINEVEDRLSSSNKAIRYYAAYELSFCKERAVADKSIPVLQYIIDTETNPELTDRAKIAMMRVDPKALEKGDRRREKADRRQEEGRTRVLRIKISGKNAQSLDISIPFVLADLALSAISDEDKEFLRRKGYDLDRVLADLEKGSGKVLDVEDRAEGAHIKIWIEIR